MSEYLKKGAIQLMRLNPNCVRDILICVEEHSDFSHPTEYTSENPFDNLLSYSHDEIAYHILQCEKSGLIDGVHYYSGGKSIDIRDLSPAGHAFIANIRNDTFFNKVKNIAKELGLNSLNDFTQIALNCSLLIIKSHFNLP